MTKKIRLAWFRWWMKPIYTNIPRSNFESVRPSSKLLQSLRRFSNKTRLMSISNASIRFKTGHNCEVSLSSFFFDDFNQTFPDSFSQKKKPRWREVKWRKMSPRGFFLSEGEIGTGKKTRKTHFFGEQMGKVFSNQSITKDQFPFPPLVLYDFFVPETDHFHTKGPLQSYRNCHNQKNSGYHVVIFQGHTKFDISLPMWNM